MHIISTILLVYDRGITSGRNIFDVKALKWDTLCGVAFNPKLEKIWRQVLSKGKLTQFDNRVRLNETIFYVITKPFRIGGVQGELALCFNERQQRKLKESRYDEIVEAQALIKNKKVFKAGLEKYFDKNGEILKSQIVQAEEFDGCSSIFCSRHMQKDELIWLFFFKEKFFIKKYFHKKKKKNKTNKK